MAKRAVMRRYFDALMEGKDGKQYLDELKRMDAPVEPPYVNPELVRLMEEHEALEDEMKTLYARAKEHPEDRQIARALAENFNRRKKISWDIKDLSKLKVEETMAPRKKEKVKRLSSKEKEEIKTNIKELLKKVYRFKDKTECKSKQRSKPFFTSKEELLKTIDANPDIRKILPANYRSLTKDQLCDHLAEDA